MSKRNVSKWTKKYLKLCQELNALRTAERSIALSLLNSRGCPSECQELKYGADEIKRLKTCVSGEMRDMRLLLRRRKFSEFTHEEIDSNSNNGADQH